MHLGLLRLVEHKFISHSVLDSVRTKELNLGRKSLPKKKFGGDFQNQGGSLSLGRDSIAIDCVYL